eukprot:184205-Alexandrium_andersonii.AAC.1
MAARNISITIEVPDLGLGDGTFAAWLLFLGWTILIGAAMHWWSKSTRSAQPAAASPPDEIAASALRSKLVETPPGVADINPSLWANQQGQYYHFFENCSHVQ